MPCTMSKYQAHKEKYFCLEGNLVIAENEAFLLNDPFNRNEYEEAFQNTKALYFKTQPGFDEILERIQNQLGKL